MRVIRKWFDYRKRNPRTKWSSPLDDTITTEWPAKFTSDLLELLNVLGWCVELEPKQEASLDSICAGPLITNKDLQAARILPVPDQARYSPSAQLDDDALILLPVSHRSPTW